MRDNAPNNGLICTWIVVADGAGRTHMEARWSQPQAVAATAA